MENTKICPTCKENKPLSDFSRNKAKKDGLSISCKVCKAKHQRDWYHRYREDHIRRVNDRGKRLTGENQEKLLAYLIEHPCVDCGESDPVVLEFDHVQGNKKTEVGRMVYDSYLWAAVLSEIEKCEVRCANCHRRKTARSQGWFKYAPLT